MSSGGRLSPVADEDGVLDAPFIPEDPDAVTKNKLGTINGV